MIFLLKIIGAIIITTRKVLLKTLATIVVYILDVQESM